MSKFYFKLVHTPIFSTSETYLKQDRVSKRFYFKKDADENDGLQLFFTDEEVEQFPTEIKRAIHGDLFRKCLLEKGTNNE